METKDRGALLQRVVDLILGVIHTTCSQSRISAKRMGLLHRLDWEQKGRDGSGIEEAQNVILGTLE